MLHRICLTLACVMFAAAPTLTVAAETTPLRNNLEGTLHEGKRCSFSKKEAILVAVGWIVGVIPGAILTPIACKKDLL